MNKKMEKMKESKCECVFYDFFLFAYNMFHYKFDGFFSFFLVEI